MSAIKESFSASIQTIGKQVLQAKLDEARALSISALNKNHEALSLIQGVVRSDFTSLKILSEAEAALNVFVGERDFEVTATQIDLLVAVSCRNILLEVQKECSLKNAYLMALSKQYGQSNEADASSISQIASTIGFLFLLSKKCEAMIAMKSANQDGWLIRDFDHQLNVLKMVEDLEEEFSITA
jgi:hypothetical protein